MIKFFECFAQFQAQVVYIGNQIAVFVGYLKSSAEVDELQGRKITGDAKKNFSHFQENIGFGDLGSGMDMETVDNNIIPLSQLHDLRKLIYRNPELGIDVPCGNFIISTSHDVRIETHATGITASVFLAKLLKDRQVVEIDVQSKIYPLYNFFKVNTIGGERYLIRRKSCPKGQFGLVDGHSIHSTSMLFQKLQNGNIG